MGKSRILRLRWESTINNDILNYNMPAVILLFIISLLFPHKAFAAGPSLSLYPPNGKYALNEEIKVLIMLDTENQDTLGTDFIATFDTRGLEIIDVVPGTLYSTYVGKTVDNENGKIAISGIVEPGEKYNGDSVFATIIGKAEKEGKATIMISFEEGSRNDSNIAGTTGSDILAEVTNGEYQIVGSGFGKTIWDSIVRFLGSFKFPLPVKD